MKAPQDWKIFERTSNARLIADSIHQLPPHWSLTPLQNKVPKRANWQTEPFIPRELIASLITNGEQAISSRTGKPYRRYWSGFGLRTGDASDGLLALDIDGASAQPILEKISGGNIPHTISWTSGKPGRYQLLYQVPADVRAKLKGFTRRVLLAHKLIESSNDIHYQYECQLLAMAYFEQHNLRSCLEYAMREAGWQVEVVTGSQVSTSELNEMKAVIHAERSLKIYASEPFATETEAQALQRAAHQREEDKPRLARHKLLSRLPGIEKQVITEKKMVRVPVSEIQAEKNVQKQPPSEAESLLPQGLDPVHIPPGNSINHEGLCGQGEVENETPQKTALSEAETQLSQGLDPVHIPPGKFTNHEGLCGQIASPLEQLIETLALCEFPVDLAAATEGYSKEQVEDAISMQDTQPKRRQLGDWYRQLSRESVSVGQELAQSGEEPEEVFADCEVLRSVVSWREIPFLQDRLDATWALLTEEEQHRLLSLHTEQEQQPVERSWGISRSEAETWGASFEWIKGGMVRIMYAAADYLRLSNGQYVNYSDLRAVGV